MNIQRNHLFAYDRARAYNLKAFGNEKNACATTVSYHLIDNGFLYKPLPYTLDLLNHIVSYTYKMILSIDKLERGDICFSCDLEGLLGPDHVYIIDTVEGNDAMVYDNYSPVSHKRNLKKGSRTPWAYAIRV